MNMSCCLSYTPCKSELVLQTLEGARARGFDVICIEDPEADVGLYLMQSMPGA